MKPDSVAGFILAFDGNEYPAFNPQFTLGTCQFPGIFHPVVHSFLCHVGKD
ncbi:hypothetical protein [Duncaniella freteri]|uniref:hypothetical protein n=1 Tax=Duncaniella freteri TaxID=2530391 RepID=UPI003F6720CE